MALFNPTQVTISPYTSSSVTPVNIEASDTIVVLLNANSNRKGASIRNDSKKANLFIDYGNEVGLDHHAVLIRPQSYFELPFNYTGAIVGIWDIPQGKALIREFI